MTITTIKIPFTEEMYVELQDHFGDGGKMDLRKYCFDAIKRVSVEAKGVMRAKKFTIQQRDENGMMAPKEIDLQTVSLDDCMPAGAAEGEDWVPEHMRNQTVERVEIKLGENSTKALNNYLRIFTYRENEQRKGELGFLRSRLADLEHNGPKSAADANAVRKAIADVEKVIAKSFTRQEILYLVTMQGIGKLLKDADTKKFDDEYEEIYGSESEAGGSPPAPAGSP